MYHTSLKEVNCGYLRGVSLFMLLSDSSPYFIFTVPSLSYVYSVKGSLTVFSPSAFILLTS